MHLVENAARIAILKHTVLVLCQHSKLGIVKALMLLEKTQ